MKNKTALEESLIQYLKEEPVFEKLMKGFREKYASYGGITGTVQLRNLKRCDIEALEGFFGVSYHGKKSATISAEKFRRALQSGKYQEISPERVLELYFGKPLSDKKDEKRRLNEQKQEILARFERKYQKTNAMEWLTGLISLLNAPTEESIDEWERQLSLGAEIINRLPYKTGEPVYLAVFAAEITGNPHGFDRTEAAGHYLYQIVRMILGKKDGKQESEEIFAAYTRQQYYLEAGIWLDDVSNYAMLYQVRAWNKKGTLHQGMEGFLKEKQSVQIPLSVISKWEKLKCQGNQIYIVENPSIYAMLCRQNPEYSFMCMNGQPGFASLLVLELFAKSGVEVFYGGDLDPEGLQIAQKLKQFYKGIFHFWYMSGEDYKKAKSNQDISERRLKILENIVDAELMEVRRLMEEYKKAAYQECMRELVEMRL